jgi:hypothetical protein
VLEKSCVKLVDKNVIPRSELACDFDYFLSRDCAEETDGA